MRKLDNRIAVFIAVIFIITVAAGCSKENNAKSSYSIEQFESAMKDKGYNYEIKDVQQDFLNATRRRMMLDNKAIDIYLFSNDKEMENEASHIDSGGCGYSNGSKAVNVCWGSFPHFYKKGSIIVQYIGTDEKIMSDLKDILGEQFAGYTPK